MGAHKEPVTNNQTQTTRGQVSGFAAVEMKQKGRKRTKIKMDSQICKLVEDGKAEKDRTRKISLFINVIDKQE